MVIVITIYNIYTNTFKDLINNSILSPSCPAFYVEYDFDHPYTKELALEDYEKPSNL